MTQPSKAPVPKKISLNLPETPYQKGKTFLVLPADLRGEVTVTKAEVTSLEGNGAWLLPVRSEEFPQEEELLLVEFTETEVITHTCRVLRRTESRILVDKPVLSDKEASQLAPFTGRHDYRVEANLPVDVRMCDDRPVSKRQAQSGQLTDISRGGLSILVRKDCGYSVGQRLEIRLISWEFPVSVETVVVRSWQDESGHRLALRFPALMSIEQREAVSTFVIQMQKREAMGRDLPSTDI